MLDRRELPMLLRAAYFGMHRVSDSHFASHGITADQFVILACLAEEDTITQKDLARRASSDPSTIRAMLVLLEGRGLVARERNLEDSRERLVILSAKGRRLFERLFKSSEPIRVQMLAGFSEDEARLLVDAPLEGRARRPPEFLREIRPGQRWTVRRRGPA